MSSYPPIQNTRSSEVNVDPRLGHRRDNLSKSNRIYLEGYNPEFHKIQILIENASDRICVPCNVCHNVKVAYIFKLRVWGSNFKLDYVLALIQYDTHLCLNLHCTIQAVGANFYIVLYLFWKLKSQKCPCFESSHHLYIPPRPSLIQSGLLT